MRSHFSTLYWNTNKTLKYSTAFAQRSQYYFVGGGSGILNIEYWVWISLNIWKFSLNMNKCTWIMNLYFSRKFTYSLCFIMFGWCFVGPVQPLSPRSLARVSQGTWAHTVGLVMWFISTVLLTDSCHDHAVIRDLSHYNSLVTLCLTPRDNTIRARVSLNSCLCFWVNFGIPSCLKSLLNRRHDSREVARFQTRPLKSITIFRPGL